MKIKLNFKKLFLSVFAVGALASTQTHALVGFSLKGGLNLSSASAQLNGNGVNDLYKNGLGFMGGLGVDIGLGPVGLVVDALYTQRKIVVGSALGIAEDSYSKTSELHIPVQAKFSLIPTVALTAGAYYSLPLGKSKSYTSNGTEAGSSDGEDDFGVVAGVSFNLAMLSVEARYNFGLKDHDDSSAGSLKTRSIDLLVGYNF